MSVSEFFISFAHQLTSFQLTLATNIPYIRGLPEIPGAIPVFDYLLKLWEDHVSVCERWWIQYSHLVFHIKPGTPGLL